MFKPDKPDPAATRVTPPPEGFPVPLMPEMPNEHSPGLKDMNN